MRDGLARRALKWVALGVMRLEAWLRRVGPAEAPRYRLAGECNGCGKCCEAPTVQSGWFTWRLGTLRWPFLFWQAAVNGFVLVGVVKSQRLFVFRCTHYDPATKRCDSYESRPWLCRDYPANLMHEAVPTLFEECGYRPVDRRAGVLLAALERSGASPEQLAAMKKKLFLDEAGPPQPPMR